MQPPSGVAPTSHEAPGEQERALPVEGQGLDKLPPSNVYTNEAGHVHPQMHQMPPHQVYVSAAMPGMPPAGGFTGLENQFQSLGFKQEDSIGTDQLTNSGPNSESNNQEEAEQEGEETEEESLKLFVGQVRPERLLSVSSHQLERASCVSRPIGSERIPNVHL